MKTSLGVSLASLAIVQMATFQSVAVAQESGLEEIVVTAQRREQNLQDVPISITAFSGDLIAQTNVRSAIDYLALTPNVSFTEDGQFGKRGAGISIRGINNLVSGENGVVSSIGTYIDEFSAASVPNQFANPNLSDMERVEVLRGPQGTYFGRNSVAGALNLTTKNPTDELGGQITVGAESYDGAGDMFNATAVVNLPVADNFALRAVVAYEDSSGTVENICAAGASAAQCPVAAANSYTPSGAADSGHEYISTRIKGLWDISDQTSVLATVMYSKEEQGHDENVPSGYLDLDTVDTLGDWDGTSDTLVHAIDPGTGFWPNNRNKLSHDLPEHNDLDTLIAIVNVKHQINDNLYLKWITGYIDAEFNRLFEQDLIGGFNMLGRQNLYEGESWSTELRLHGSTEQLDWVVGAIIGEDQNTQDNKVFVSTGAMSGHLLTSGCPTCTAGAGAILPPFPDGLGLALNHKNFEVESVAVFGEVTWHASDQVDVTVGGRFTHDEVTNELWGNGIAPGQVPGVGGPPGFGNVPRDPASADAEFDDFAPRLVVQYQFSDDASGYATISKGYKAGGNSTGNRTDLPTSAGFTVPFDEEVLWNYELGIKSELLDNRLRLNAAIFRLDWEDAQFESFRFLVPGDLTTNFEQTINIADSEATGVEIEFVAVPTDRLTLTGGWGYLDTEITSNEIVEITGGYKVAVNGLVIPKAPELTWNLTGEYRWPFGDSEAWVRAEFIHRDGQYSDIEGLTNRQTRGVSPNGGSARLVGAGDFPYRSPDYEVLNLRAGVLWNEWSFTVYGQNVTDEEYYTGTQENFGMSGIRLRPHPATFGLSVSYDW